MVAQVVLAIVVLAGAGLLLRTLANLRTVDMISGSSHTEAPDLEC